MPTPDTPTLRILLQLRAHETQRVEWSYVELHDEREQALDVETEFEEPAAQA